MKSNILDNIDNKYWIWISRLRKITNVQIQYLIKIYNEPKNLWNAKDKELLKIKGINKNIVNEILNPIYRKNLDKYIEYMYKHDISIINIYSKYYPQKLKNIYDYPLVLYVKGDIKILNNMSITITGIRKSSIYGEKQSRKFAYELAKNNLTIVSGLAYGIETYAHIGAIDAKGKTIVVLPFGLDNIYPRENKKLYERTLLNGGTIISEHIIGTMPQKIYFILKNRILSGLSDGLLVIESKEKGGTLTTVDFALEQGKNIFAIPGNITSSNSIGTNMLIQQGAKLVLNIKDILDEYIF